jgi:hypothetical protein
MGGAALSAGSCPHESEVHSTKVESTPEVLGFMIGSVSKTHFGAHLRIRPGAAGDRKFTKVLALTGKIAVTNNGSFRLLPLATVLARTRRAEAPPAAVVVRPLHTTELRVTLGGGQSSALNVVQ